MRPRAKFRFLLRIGGRARRAADGGSVRSRPCARSRSTPPTRRTRSAAICPRTSTGSSSSSSAAAPTGSLRRARPGVRCDVLVISGHYDGGNEFFSDHLEAHEFLPVAEMERVSCSDSCPGLFSQLKEVYLFGCNTLNPKRSAARRPRSCAASCAAGSRDGDAERLARSLERRPRREAAATGCASCSRTFREIYGFSSVAPLGPQAAATLSRYFQANGTGEVGTGRVEQPAPGPVRGELDGGDARDDGRRSACGDPPRRVPVRRRAPVRTRRSSRFVHQLLQRRDGGSADVSRPHRGVRGDARRARRGSRSDVAQALDGDRAATARRATRYLEFAARCRPAVRCARACSTSRRSSAGCRRTELRAEQLRMIDEMLRAQRRRAPATSTSSARSTTGPRARRRSTRRRGAVDDVAHAAVRACLGSADGHARTLAGAHERSRGRCRRSRRPTCATGRSPTSTSCAESTAGHRADERIGRAGAGAAGARRGIACRIPRASSSWRALFPVAESLTVQTRDRRRAHPRRLHRDRSPSELVRTLREHRRQVVPMATT